MGPKDSQRAGEHAEGSGSEQGGRCGKEEGRGVLLLQCCSRCWQQQAGLRKTCNHSCNTDSD